MVHTSRRVAAVVAVVAVVAVGLVAWSLSRSDDTSALPTRTVRAGEVEVTLTPLTLDTSGAVFRVALDTHTVPLDLDVAASARLRVNGTTADGASWDGPGPGGHHREGTVRFTTPVPAGAAVELRITGLPADAAASWTAP
ncbi:hypothetical protein GCM10010492_58560 [Saccharothrix mutabilis subsp. mutabilis]|uniref:Uncharacterized protein n=1 Tax=Saccharothrix mutabilis subsp. mutabilis TaxID=66855 RepID=A0ABN0UHC8_9PSEU